MQLSQVSTGVCFDLPSVRPCNSMHNLQGALCIKQVLIILMQDYSLLTPNWLLLAPVCLQLRLCNCRCHCRLALHRLKPSSFWFHPSLGALTLLARGATSHHPFF